MCFRSRSCVAYNYVCFLFLSYGPLSLYAFLYNLRSCTCHHSLRTSSRGCVKHMNECSSFLNLRAMPSLSFADILMLIKRRPPKLYGFVEYNYRHEHVIITKLYIVVDILYDRHLYDFILWAFCACSKEAFGCTHPTPCGMHCPLLN